VPQCDVSGIRRRRQWSPDARALGMIGDRWMLLIVRELAFGPMRLSELQRAFPGLSTGALEQRLSRMAADQLVVRRRYAEVPPRVEFELTESGRALVDILGPVVRWALRWAWSEPTQEEWVDVTALFRLACCLIDAPDDVEGELELVVEDDEQLVRDFYTLVLRDGRAGVEHRPAAHGDAVITASRHAWAEALGPRGARERLRVTGDERLAQAFLDSFARERDLQR